LKSAGLVVGPCVVITGLDLGMRCCWDDFAVSWKVEKLRLHLYLLAQVWELAEIQQYFLAVGKKRKVGTLSNHSYIEPPCLWWSLTRRGEEKLWDTEQLEEHDA